jgi:hypothetical protein
LVLLGSGAFWWVLVCPGEFWCVLVRFGGSGEFLWALVRSDGFRRVLVGARILYFMDYFGGCWRVLACVLMGSWRVLMGSGVFWWVLGFCLVLVDIGGLWFFLVKSWWVLVRSGVFW